MMKKRVKEGSAVLLALALAFSALSLPGARAANAVDTNASCSVEFSIGGDYEDLKTIEGGVPINLYKVASIDETGAYKAEKGFESLDLSSVENNNSSADTWLKRAEEANKLIKGTTPAATTTTVGGKALASNLATGLYLITAEEVKAANYVYNFTPYLISLPNNYYYASGDDTWVYDLTGANAVGLKPEQTARFGSLEITKELLDHHITLGEKATFVFQIDITTLDGKTEARQIALTFDGYGSKSAVIDNIPAGSDVVVTEIYSGAGYETVGSDSVNTTIVADDTVSAGFQNQHDGHLQGGYGVVNNFKLNENNQYDWNKMNDNADAQE
ncbi:DUF5979 domain-containing protein [Bariatricus massiliensis]|uniref:DUF5979 domain-containing protein n=1 Tax=Bariatricus massiliensis TaxID=1745713 RepID=A0ABS8DJI4_9FIRM|nr:DUF5979 domain-containing protein [Bariatricus massiliensis]MCB7305031.1 DUF5979 domain-containing protein [Bariatricus massiliensis]MCB7375628.1 DUF5979 domain-containing protein [Bariatricus massiliensis]MCB7388217.1 DUF5979 domain-containing protein [Bariatricus massiliensis]MCB7412347.1 DUF5979 domain-containing protein [Bariatricus massiliensis]MCQ5254671.1 DUF5979 domain-containing protein [Bariatricus massiliensis]